ncbi:MAG: adenosylcobinamide-GDP ribazoletransferase [Hyphomicrobiales bacterium]|nr:adenosylcobinamide-GDP ribazoletransferase [Hyphomicrobiales bacterium]
MRTEKIKDAADDAAGDGHLRKLAEELGLAFSLLTRIRLPVFEVRTTANTASAFWAYPIAGAVIGGIGALAFWLAVTFEMSIAVAAIISVATMLLVGGGLHEDGFADFWDGLGGGRTRERKIEIMRDSRLGTYGALALVIMIALHIVLLADIYDRSGLSVTLLVLIASEAAARGMIAVPCYFTSPASGNGLGAVMAAAGGRTLLSGGILGAAIACFLLMEAGLALTIGALAGAVAISILATRYLGGFTGDVLGASVVLSRLFALCLAAAAL